MMKLRICALRSRGHDVSCPYRGDLVEQVGFDEMDLSGDGMASSVAAGDGEGRVRNIGGVNRCAGQFLCKRYGDAAGAGTDIGDLRAFAGEHLFAAGAAFADGEAVEVDFDDVRGFGG